MTRKPAKRRTAPAKKKKKTHVVVGIKLEKAPTKEQLAALEQAFNVDSLASAGLPVGASITRQRVEIRRRRRT